jgi:hypothetical protein
MPKGKPCMVRHRKLLANFYIATLERELYTYKDKQSRQKQQLQFPKAKDTLA